MTLIKSISGIRGTIGGNVGDNLTPIDAVKFASAYGTWLKQQRDKTDYKVVVGRDARLSGDMIQNLVMNTLVGLGINVVDLGLSTTPTVELAVPMEHADGGIILTASHNPKQYNGFKAYWNDGAQVTPPHDQEIIDQFKSNSIRVSVFIHQLFLLKKKNSFLYSIQNLKL